MTLRRHQDVLARLLYGLTYLVLVGVVSLFGPRDSGPKYVVDPSSFFRLLNGLFVQQGFALSVLAIALLAAANRLVAPAARRPPWLLEAVLAVGATTYWLLCRMLFVWLADVSGACHGHARAPLAGRRACLHAGGHWDGLDISGHCFLAALACGYFYDQLQAAGRSLLGCCAAQPGATPRLEAGMPRAPSRAVPAGAWPFFGAALGLTLALWAAWTSLLLHTSLYFHTAAEKLLGLLLGFAYWAFAAGVLHTAARPAPR